MWTGHLSVCTIQKYYNGSRALGCQPPNFDPQISPKWHNSVKNGPEIRLMLRKPYINGFRNMAWTF